MSTIVLTQSTVPDDRPRVSLLGGFSVRDGGKPVALPMHSRRVVAYLSLDQVAQPDCDRVLLSERLWPDACEDRARASLRTALWRIRRASPGLVQCAGDRVMLADDVRVDVHQYRGDAHRLLSNGTDCPGERSQLMARNCELLPGWDEAWLLLAREQLRQLRLHALEVAGKRLADAGSYAEAIDVMLTVVGEEPLRESAQTVLIEAHLCEGNIIEARRQFDTYAAMLWSELRVRPSVELYGRVRAAPPPPMTARPAVRTTRRESTNSVSNGDERRLFTAAAHPRLHP
jgi:DNA-binding SARP family transcriptional activator